MFGECNLTCLLCKRVAVLEVNTKNSEDDKLEIVFIIILPTSLKKCKLFDKNGLVAKENKIFKH